MQVHLLQKYLAVESGGGSQVYKAPRRGLCALLSCASLVWNEHTVSYERMIQKHL